MADAFRDVRGIAALVTICGGIVAYVALVLNGEQDSAEQVLALAATALAYVLGLGSDPRALDAGDEGAE